MRQEKGITLIALVITIIVLLILAGVSIAMLTGNNGILTKANDTKVAQEKSEFKEAIQLAAGKITADVLDPSNATAAAGLTVTAIKTQMGTDAYKSISKVTATEPDKLVLAGDTGTYTATLTIANGYVTNIAGLD